MRIFAGYFRKLLFITILIILVSSPGVINAQDESPDAPLVIAEILHPSLEEPVAPLDTLILIKIDEFYVGSDYYYLILLDNKPVTARWDPDALSFSYYPDRMLTTGEHYIEVYLTVVDGPEHQLVAEGTFIVAGGAPGPIPQEPSSLFDLGTAPTPPPPPPTSVSRYSTDFFRLNGRASMDAGFTELDGLGARLRQEPDNTTIFNLNGTGRSEGTDFDFRFYLTTDETRYQQPRNRYSFNAATDKYGISVGDTTTRLGTLLLDGLRVRGLGGWGKYGAFTVRIVEGEARRETESKYDIDGNIRQRGQGSQRLWATRVGLFEDSPFSLGFSYLSGDENASDTGTSGNPGSNTVRSVDFLWEFDNGAIRGAWAESDYNFDDPAMDDLSGETARELEAAYNLSGHALKLRWQLIDPGFRSIGRLSLQKDREQWSFDDRFNISRGILTGRLYYEKYHNNLDDTLTYTTNSTRYGGQLRYRFGLQGPTLTLGLDRTDRTNNANEGDTGWLDESSNSIILGLQQSIIMPDARHDLRVNWRTVKRDNIANPSGNTNQDIITVSLVSRWQRGFSIDVQYGNTDNDYTGRSTFTEVDRYSVRLSYADPERVFNAWTRWEMVDSSGNQATYDSNRETLQFGMRWNLGSDLSLETSFNLVNFDDNSDSANDFKEHTFKIMLIQLIN
jgi:hypothetical protein